MKTGEWKIKSTGTSQWREREGGWEDRGLPQRNAKSTKRGSVPSALSVPFRGPWSWLPSRPSAFVLTLFAAAHLLSPLSQLPVLAQPYAIDWHTIDGGGGTSTGGVYAISGTIGQPDAGGPMTGGPYSLTGGFWSLIAVQTPGAPFLTIEPAGPGQATVSWSPDTPGFVLQEAAMLAPVSWTNSPSGSTNPVVVPAPGPTKFYRLHKP